MTLTSKNCVREKVCNAFQLAFFYLNQNSAVVTFSLCTVTFLTVCTVIAEGMFIAKQWLLTRCTHDIVFFQVHLDTL